jgi:class 3 adenylate cyclase/tetratricopeptide (TPR) repeat protein
MVDRLAPYLCDLHREWLACDAASSWRDEDGSLLFFDISGFTPLAERLAKRGKAGVEQLIDTLNGVLAPLVGTAGALGGDTLKFGGDALLVLFSGSDHARRACAAAWDMQDAMAPFRRMRTEAGIMSLRASAAIASGPVHAFLAGDRFRELIVAGPVTSEVMGLQSDAEPGEVLLGPAAAAALSAHEHGADRGDGVAALRARPSVSFDPPPAAPLAECSRALPAALRDHLGPGAESEHRQVTVAFAQFRGLDELLARQGAAAAAAELDALMSRVQRACDVHGVTFLATDTDRGAGKVFVVTGAPNASTDDEDRMLYALREIVAHQGELRLRAGVNRGRAFVVHLGAAHRRTYTMMGDTTNLAARVMAHAADGTVLATRAVLACARAPFALTPVAPFAVKGKRALVEAELVGEPHAVASRAVTGSPLAGREVELAVLRGAVAAARAGDGRIVELVGEPGIGKSRLLAEVAGEAAEAGLLKLVVEAGAYCAATPYFALRAPLRALLEPADDSEEAAVVALTERVREHLPRTEPLLPLLAIAFGLELPATAESARVSADFSRTQLHFLVDRLLAALLPRGQTLLLVEDAQWLDEASSDLLRAVLRQVGERGWAALVARRPGEEGLSELPGPHTRIELEPLAPEAAQALATAGAGRALAPHVTSALVQRANGNPLFLRELVAAARRGADLDGLPETVEALMTARIDTLMPADRRLLRRAAVLGQRFPMNWLRGMLELGEIELTAALARLGDFLDVESDSVRFGHALQREAAYEALPYERRRALHARAGELIERELGLYADDSADILALHFLRAGEYVRAWSYGRAAAEQARDSFAYADAAQLYRRALEAGTMLGLAAGELADVWEALGEAHARTGEPAAADEALTRARGMVAGDVLREAQLLHRHAEIATEAGHVNRAVRWVRRALRLLDGRTDVAAREQRAHLNATLASVRRHEGKMDAAIALCQLAIEDAEASKADAALARACYNLDAALIESGHPQAEANHSARALEIYRRLGDLRHESAVLNNLGAFAYREGRWDDAVALYRHASETSARAGGVADAAFGDFNIGELRSDQGRFTDADQRLRRALETWRATGDDHGVAFATALLGRLAGRAGRGEEGARLLADARIRFRSLRLSQDVLQVQAFEVENLAFRGLAEQALAASEKLIEDLLGGGRLGALLKRVHGFALAQAGQLDEAAAALDASLREARELGEAYEIALSLDAVLALGERIGRVRPRLRRERDEIVTRLDIAALPPTPVGEPAGVARVGQLR